ncbi:TRAP transporter substrate-binding protein [Castellaniella sp. WN]
MKPQFTLAVLAASLALMSPAHADTLTLDMASVYPKDMKFLGEGAQVFADQLARISDGRIKVTIYGAGDLVPPLEVMDTVSKNAVPMGFDWPGYWGGKLPVANLVGSLPFGPAPDVLAGWLWRGGGMEIIQKAYDKVNIHFIPCTITPPEPAGWFNKEIKSPDDLKGLNMRIGGLAGRAMAKLGVNTQVIPGGEVFVSLSRGRIDAAEYSLPMIDYDLQMQKAAKYYYFPGWHQPSSVNSLEINKTVWDGLDKAQQGQIEGACKIAMLWSLNENAAKQLDTLKKMRDSGTQVRRLPDDVMQALKDATDRVIAEERKSSPIFDEAYASLADYIDSSRQWKDLQSLDVGR